MIDLTLFHFLRPACLFLLLPAAAITWFIFKRQDLARPWRKVITPELLEHLLLQEEGARSRIRPASIMALCWLLGIFALAGPTWEKEASPFGEDQAALFIILKVTPEMLAEDIQPSRLQRSVQKIGDLLALRGGTKTGLIAFAGSAHLVMPLTSDAAIIRDFAAELEPGVMPRAGNDPAAAIELAQRRLKNSNLAGSILLISDFIDGSQLEGLAAAHAQSSVDVHLYAMAAGPEADVPPDSPPAPALDRAGMQDAADALGGDLILPTADDSDVQKLNGKIDRSISRAPSLQGERWKDAGYFVLPLLLLLMLAFFRPGGAVAVQQ